MPSIDFVQPVKQYAADSTEGERRYSPARCTGAVKRLVQHPPDAVRDAGPGGWGSPRSCATWAGSSGWSRRGRRRAGRTGRTQTGAQAARLIRDTVEPWTHRAPPRR